MTTKAVKLVLFDAFDTLIKPRQPIPNQYSHVFVKHGVNISPDVVKQSFKGKFAELNDKAGNYGKKLSWTPNQWWSTLIKMVIEEHVSAVDDKTLGVIQNELLTRFASSDGYEAFQGSYDTLSAINRAGIKCGLVSNSDERIVSVLESLSLRQFLSRISLSYNVGHEKPEREIFQDALKVDGSIRPSEVLFVGDEYKADYLGAKDAGMKPLLLYQAGYHKEIDEQTLKSVDHIDKITDVLEYI